MKSLKWVICGVLAITGAINSVAQGENRKLFIQESDYVISPEEARGSQPKS